MYIKFLPSQYVLRYNRGKLVSEGVGLSFFYLDSFTSACAVPIPNNDADFVFEVATQDFQNVTVQGQLTYRIIDYKCTAGAVDFTVNLKTKRYNNDPMLKLSKRIINIAGVLVKSRIGKTDMTEAIQSSQSLAAGVLEQMQQNDEIKGLGIAVTGFSVLKISAKPETVRALEATTREEILRQSDDALYERRNASIEQERRVKENELNTEITVEEKKKKIRETEIQTRRMVLEKESELARIKTLSDVEQEQLRLDAEIELERKRRELAELRFENAKKDADAEAYRIGAIMDAYSRLNADVLVALATLNMEPEMVIAQAFEKLAANSGNIGTLNITPDLLESLTVKSEKTA